MVIDKVSEIFQKFDQKKAQWIVATALFVIATLLGNLMSSGLKTLDNLFQLNPQTKTVSDFIGFHMIDFFPLYVILYGIAGASFFVVWTQLKASYESMEQGNKGTARWTTLTELYEQYTQVPKLAKSDDETYPGLSGTLIAQDGDVSFIDEGPAHNKITGRSRSGKDQTKVLPDLDLYSRAEEKPHIISVSTKYEVFAAAKERLEKRGYEVSLFNLIHLERSLMFNPLELIKKAYMKGDVDEAIELCKTFSFPLYHNEEAKEPVWEETAMALVNAIILALCYEFIEKSENPKLTEKYVTLYSAVMMLIELGATDKHGNTLLDKYFASLEPDNPARMEYSTVQFADGQMRSSIFASTQAKLRNFIAPKVAKMMSKSNFGFDRFLGFEGAYTTLIVDEMADSEVDYRENPFKAFDLGSFKTGSEVPLPIVEPVSSQSKMISGFAVPGSTVTVILPTLENATGEFEQLSVTATKSGTFSIKLEKQIESNQAVKVNMAIIKPQAVFMVLPDYIETNYIIASTWIQQVYFVTSQYASENGDKLKKRIRAQLNEFGNLPAFSNIPSIISVGAGRGFLVDFYLQNDNQLRLKYDETHAKIIESEAMNTFFIFSKDKLTRDNFSEQLGETEYISKSRSGGLFSFHKQYTETVETRPLMKSDELGRLMEGETVVDRSVKRRDLKGNKIVPHPIWNRGKTSYSYAYEYLTEQFPNDRNWRQLDMPKVTDIPLKKYGEEFVKRIRRPLNKLLKEESEQENRVELDDIMSHEDAVLDKEYKGFGTGESAAEFEDIQEVKLHVERKLMSEAFSSEDIYVMYQAAIGLYPEKTGEIDSMDYVEEYQDFLALPEHRELNEKYAKLGFFN
ncbi:VirD4-like conjugal transfer protein, CD1115 family [Carnobacterium maltaromaticum]|uniref:VirD4-like conjugal transfer protein, CD1115 family n=1 Tax=Carnobacterium maltaromaticum TaxID=2751 RepID=UPI0012FABF24|nr:type IV secretory system conjugative DNA transfer family protein [Carnobacterium maltaromaticum]